MRKPDAFELHIMSNRQIILPDLHILESRQRMKDILQQYEDEMEDIRKGVLPTKYGFEVWNAMHKYQLERHKDQLERINKFKSIKKRVKLLKLLRRYKII